MTTHVIYRTVTESSSLMYSLHDLASYFKTLVGGPAGI